MPSHIHNPRILFALPLLFASLGLVGCSNDVEEEKVPPLQPVKGQVLLNGEPTQGISVSFVPIGGTTGGGGYGMTDANGNYTLQYRNGEPGIPAGEYAVLFSKLVQPDGSPIPEGKSAADVGAVDVIPESYRNMQTQNQAKVTEGENSFDFKLSS